MQPAKRMIVVALAPADKSEFDPRSGNATGVFDNRLARKNSTQGGMRQLCARALEHAASASVVHDRR
jgi:hypothetical protein